MSDSVFEARMSGATGFDEFGLNPSDREKLSYLIGIDMKLARKYLAGCGKRQEFCNEGARSASH